MEPLSDHSEREWILIGMTESCAARGYDATTVGDVCAAAGVSRESFEQAFADRAECLGAAMESTVENTWRALDKVVSPDKPWAGNLREGAIALLGALAERPAFAHVALVEASVAGGRAGALRISCRAALLDFLAGGHEQTDPGVPASATRSALAGAEALVVTKILAGEGERLVELAPDVVYMLAVPFLGCSEAARLAARPAGRGHLRAVA